MHDGQQQQCFKEGPYVCLLKSLGIDNPRRIHTSLCATPAVENQQEQNARGKPTYHRRPLIAGRRGSKRLFVCCTLLKKRLPGHHGKPNAAEASKKAGHPNEQSGRVPSDETKFSRGLWSWQGSRSFLCRRKCPRH